MTTAWITNDFAHPDLLIPNGCSYYRQYLPMLVAGQRARYGRPAWDSARGFGVKDGTKYGVFGFDTVNLKLLMDKWTLAQIPLAQALGQRILVDVDDHFDGLTPDNKAYDITDPSLNRMMNREIYRDVIAAADLVTVSTPYLAEVVNDINSNVTVIRNGVWPKQFPRHEQRERPVLGWTGSVNYRNGDLQVLADWLPDFLETHDLLFHHVGHEPDSPSFADLTGINPARLITTPLLPIIDYHKGFVFDIGLVPLTDIPFNRAKSNIKGLEMAAAGIPFVASDLPEYRTLHNDGIGLLAQTAGDWEAQVIYLLDYATRRKAGATWRNWVTERWSIEARAREWQRALTS